ncbi:MULTISPECIES: PfaB family protein [unclassified Shewanella]|uniref:PfaB family protein n=1 Tax=unclassified Shewanella TaxID=196818 RepID=UPI002FCDDE69
MTTKPLSPATEPASNKIAMPLRIALLVLPSIELNSDELAALLPELNRPDFSGEQASAQNLSLVDSIVKITVDDFKDASFEKQLDRTISAIEDGKLVQLNTTEHALLMMPALKAAQLRIHPHAQLTAMQRANTNSSNSADSSLTSALAQAKRDGAHLSKLEQHNDLDSKAQFAAVHQLISQLASRTHYRDELNNGVALSPKQARSHYWFTEYHQARVAAISFNNGPQSVSFVIAQGTGFIAAKSLLNHQRLQFIVCGDNQAELSLAITTLAAELEALTTEHSGHTAHSDTSVLQAMVNNLKQYKANSAKTETKAQLCAVLNATSVAAMQLELSALKAAVAKTIAEQTQYKTPSGSYFTAHALGNQAEAGLAFVYPGVGTVYADMLSELHQYFPALYAKLEREGDLKSMLQAEQIYHLDPKHAAAMDLGDLAIAGVGSSYILTQLLTDEFKVRPDFALGYSMGEASMWASLGVWKNPHELISKTQTDALFTSVISGKLTAVRQAWQLGNNEPDIVWNSFVVRSPAAPIKALLVDYPRAYIAIIQGDTCVIAGCESQCRALLSALGKRGIAANRVTAMHTPPAMVEHHNVVSFYQQPLRDELPNEIKFISAANLCGSEPRHQAINQASQLNSQLVAQSIADTFCHTLDFTALIHSAQRQGAKLFVELGADRQNCTLIDKIAKQDSQDANAAALLENAPCCTVPMNAKGSSDAVNLIKALGQLISHGVPMSVTPLIDGLVREIARTTLLSKQRPNSTGQGQQDSSNAVASSYDTTSLKGEV